MIHKQCFYANTDHVGKAKSHTDVAGCYLYESATYCPQTLYLQRRCYSHSTVDAGGDVKSYVSYLHFPCYALLVGAVSFKVENAQLT